jgi:hypothetical protein
MLTKRKVYFLTFTACVVPSAAGVATTGVEHVFLGHDVIMGTPTVPTTCAADQATICWPPRAPRVFRLETRHRTPSTAPGATTSLIP